MDEKVAPVAVLGGGDAAESDVAVFDFQLNCFVALCANRFYDRVRVEGGGDAEHVPGAVGVVGFAVRVDFEVRGYA